jgi:hypothetical protein
MKTIFRSTVAVFMFAAVIALGPVLGFGQSPCEDADGQTALYNKFTGNYPSTKTLAERKMALDAGKQYLEKYGSCEANKEISDYLKGYLPKLEGQIIKKEHDLEVEKIVASFIAAMKAKNWDDVYSTGKKLMAENPDNYRQIELVFGSIGLDETAKSPRVTKWNDETLRYARQSIADIEAGKKFNTFGIAIKDGPNFLYKDAADALGWMNYTIGYILATDKNNKKEGAAYLYKASQAASETKKNAVVFEWIGAYYFDLAAKLFSENKDLAIALKAMQDSINTTDTPEVRQQKVDAFKAKNEELKARVGIQNGTVERALDAYSRAYSLAPATPDGKKYQANIRATLTQLYKARFDKTDGLDAFVTATQSKPLPDPSSTIAPVIDPEPATTTTTTTGTKPVNPAPKPGASGKPQSAVPGVVKADASAAVASKPTVRKP